MLTWHERKAYSVTEYWAAIGPCSLHVRSTDNINVSFREASVKVLAWGYTVPVIEEADWAGTVEHAVETSFIHHVDGVGPATRGPACVTYRADPAVRMTVDESKQWCTRLARDRLEQLVNTLESDPPDPVK